MYVQKSYKYKSETMISNFCVPDSAALRLLYHMSQNHRIS